MTRRLPRLPPRTVYPPRPVSHPDPQPAAPGSAAPVPAGPPATMSEAWTRHKRFMRRIGPAGPLAVAALAMPPISGISLIYFMKSVAEWLRSHQETGVIMYAGGFALLSGLALLPTYAQAALGGYAFGMWIGLAAAMVGFAGGSSIGYLIARAASKDRVATIIAENPKWQAVRDALVGDRGSRGFWKTTGMVALLRMPPNSPFALTNLVMASVKVPYPQFVIGTVLGMLPRTAAAVWIGATVDAVTDGGFTTPLWLKIIGLVLAVVVLMVVMDIAERAIARVNNPGAVPPVFKTLAPKLAGGLVIASLLSGLLIYRDARTRAKAEAAAATTPASGSSPLPTTGPTNPPSP